MWSSADVVLSFLHGSSGSRNSFQSHLSDLHDDYLLPYLFKPLDNILNNGVSKADVVSLVILVAMFWISLRILDYARRVIMWWVTMAFRLVFWMALLGGAWYVYNVGIDKALRDVGWMWGLLEGFLVDQGTQPRRNAQPSWQRQQPSWQRQQVPLRGRTGHR